MTIKTWAALANNEGVALAEIFDAVANGQLMYSGATPTAGDFDTPPSGAHANGYVFTRQDYEAWIEHSSMAASGIALNEMMTKSEMVTYRVLLVNAVINEDFASDRGVSNPETHWRGQATFDVHNNTESVLVERNINGSGYSSDGTMDVTPSGTGYATGYNEYANGDSVDVRLTPFTGNGGTGSAGTPVIVNIGEPPL